MLKDEIKYLSTDLPTLGEVFLKVTGEELNNNENDRLTALFEKN